MPTKATKRYLTKSRFKLATECPTKLFYEGNREYVNAKSEDEFLKALADGGFQIGALAQVLHPGGHLVEERDPDKAVAETAELMQQKSVTLFEAAVRSGDYLIRADVLEKRGKKLALKEVKAKSWEADTQFWMKDKKKGLLAKWLPYLLDVAFQTHVASLAYPDYEVTPFLVLVDKQVVVTRDGLHQKFKVERSEKRTEVSTTPGLTDKDIGANFLREIDVREEVEFLLRKGQDGFTVPELAKRYAEVMKGKDRSPPQFGKACKGCEFRGDPGQLGPREKSGFHECMLICLKEPVTAEKPLVFQLWNCKKTEKLIDNGYRFLSDLDPEEFAEEEPDGGPLELGQRHYLQILAAKKKAAKTWCDTKGLKKEMKKWRYPLHFIDFETCMVAIPFFKGQRPYQQIAFQFSHHVMEKDGSVRHQTEFLMPDRGRYPNVEFVRALRNALSADQGTIFRYSNHENTVLNQLRKQLLEGAGTVPDKTELVSFIESITRRTDDEWEGDRVMVDLWDLYKKYHHIPGAQGSTSLKYVLPAILNDTDALKEKYARPLYGTKDLPSKNFKERAWIHLDERGQVKDPYKSLEPMLQGFSQEELERYVDEEGIRNGGTAMMAWAKLQFMETTPAEEKRIRSELLRYCELDTFAMVLIVEAWKSLALG